MDEPTPGPELIKQNAAAVARIASTLLGKELGYDEAGVRWLDEYIQNQHLQGDPELRDKLADRLGSFLGECIIRTYGGRWEQENGNWCVRLGPGNAAFPFVKVAKQLAHGREGGDSVLAFFTAIPAVFKRNGPSPCP